MSMSGPIISEDLLALEPINLSDVTDVQPDLARRRALVAGTTVLGGIGIALATVPSLRVCCLAKEPRWQALQLKRTSVSLSLARY